MPGLPSLDAEQKKLAAGAAIVASVLFFIGIGIGYGSAPDSTPDPCTFRKSLIGCSVSPYRLGSKNDFTRKVDQFMSDACVRVDQSCHKVGLPRTYIAYHLNDKTIQIDGVGNDSAWAEVAWTETLVDIRATYFPTPRYETKAKVRWDDKMIYILGYLQEPNLFANMTEPDSDVWRDNAFEVLMDVDGSFANYKQIQINVLGVTTDLMFSRSPFDSLISNWTVLNRTWSAGGNKAVFAKGTINTPGDKDDYWTFEMSLNLSALAMKANRTSPVPSNNEVWFTQFLRGEWNLSVVNKVYVKNATGTAEDWWSWQPMGAINVHLQDRFGLMQFKRDLNDRNFFFPKWHVYRALFDILTAQKEYLATTGKLTTDLRELNIPAYHQSRVCTEIPTIDLIVVNGTQTFQVNVKSRIVNGPAGHIRSDRYTWFQ